MSDPRQPYRDHAYEWKREYGAYTPLCVYKAVYKDANMFRPRGRPCGHCQKVLDRRAEFARERADNFREHGHEFQKVSAEVPRRPEA